MQNDSSFGNSTFIYIAQITKSGTNAMTIVHFVTFLVFCFFTLHCKHHFNNVSPYASTLYQLVHQINASHFERTRIQFNKVSCHCLFFFSSLSTFFTAFLQNFNFLQNLNPLFLRSVLQRYKMYECNFVVNYFEMIFHRAK